MLNAHAHPLTIVVAVDSEGGYVKNGTIPWNIPEDMKRFKETTMGGVCIMGRATYADMIDIQQSKLKEGDVPPETPRPLLTGRESFVLSSNPNFDPVGATAGSSITGVISKLDDGDTRPVFILGGYRLFVEALSRPCAVHLTVIKGDPYGCDRFFPLSVLNSRYKIVAGDETDHCFNVVYHPIPQQRAFSQQDMWDKIINENFRAV